MSMPSTFLGVPALWAAVIIYGVGILCSMVVGIVISNLLNSEGGD